MRRKMAGAILAIALASAGGAACGMTHSTAKSDRCRVLGGEKLPAAIGGEEQICAAIEAAAAGVPGEAYSVEVLVRSDYMLSAQVRMADGRSLPELKLAVSDRQLTRRSIERFATSVGEAIRRAAAG